ncbi:MAG: Do family serine endopeptidase [Candidatus Eisenbacteria bacterium]|nr:Do family serine endopeptidase [Candidatus Eisenbacteria bacterium]
MNPSSRPIHRPRSYYLGAALLMVAGIGIGLGLSASFSLPRGSSAAKSAAAAINPSVSSSAVPESPFVSVVEKTLPAVVFIDVRKKASAGDSSDPQSEMLKRFFGDQPFGRHPQTTPTSGSGFIIDSEGHILTNNHVVRDAADITVTLNDKRSFKAKVVGADPGTDVAVIKIEAGNLPSLPLGDSDRLRVGDWAIAIGNPLGVLRGSVTVGIISAEGRSNLNIFGGTPDFQDFIQTDASINFGNSGGPLCNIRGEAIGINTAINPSGQGIGFAIPINLARHVADQLLAHGKVSRAMLGVNLADLTPEIAEGFGLALSTQGVVIQNVMDNSPAARAGIKRNDVIIEFDGRPVEDMAKFRLRVADTPAGRDVPIVVLRDGKRMSFNVTLDDREKLIASNAGGAGGETPQAEDVKATAGLKLRELTAEEKTKAKLTGGVVVIDVEEGSVADQAGIQQNDVIEQVNRQDVSSAAAFTKLISDAKKEKKPAVLLVHGQQGPQFVPLQLNGQ